MLTPMAASGAEPLGSMGTDTPTAVLSQRSRLLYDYFVELFAQVTNPPLDAIREEVVTSMSRVMGPEHNLLEPTAASCRQIVLRVAGARQRRAEQDRPHQRRRRAARAEDQGAARALRRRARRRRSGRRVGGPADPRVRGHREGRHGRSSSPTATPTTPRRRSRRCSRCRPCTTTWCAPRSARGRPGGRERRRPRGAPHRDADRFRRGSGEPVPGVRVDRGPDPRGRAHRHRDAPTAVRNYLKALGKGVMKVMSKMGISTVASYTGAQAFEAIGLNRDVIDEYLTGTPSQLGGVGLDVLAEEVKLRHRRAYPENPDRTRAPPARGGRRVRVPARGRAAPLHPGSGLPASAFDAHRASRRLRASTPTR